MVKPTLEHYLEQASRGAGIVPVWEELVVDLDTPISIYKKVSKGDYTYLLESVDGGETVARYSFIGLRPLLILTSSGNRLFIQEGSTRRSELGNPLYKIGEILASYAVEPQPGLPRFFGGAVGYFGYDLVRHVETLPMQAEDDLHLPDSYLVITEVVLIYDHVERRLKVVVLSRPGDNPRLAYEKALESIAAIESDLSREVYDPLGRRVEENSQELPLDFRSNISQERFMQDVEKAKEYIAAGDIFQVVLSQRLEAPVSCPPFEIYRVLRRLNPSPYMYYLNFGDLQVVGSSPEMLVRVEGSVVLNHPIAGTRKRGRDAEEDREMELDLVADEKERAEHLMLVDLARNDVGRISAYGSVTVPQFMEVERYSHVMHMVTTVQGELAPGVNAYDALLACFPAGTVSGAPKVRAMEIIEELEPTRRGPYAGAIGYLGFNGSLDTCITIRTMIVHQGKAYVQAGAGIVADSVPEKEYQETLSKASALLAALHQAEKQYRSKLKQQMPTSSI
ncbi:MAG: anthranilate synthase component I [Bacillota bacterium]